MFLSLTGIDVGYGRTSVLKGIDLAIDKGEFVALLGSSGCGKTTLLRTIAGFVRPTCGMVAVAGRDVTHAAPDKRGMALVFQSYALWPHMTVERNIGYGLKLKGLPRTEVVRRVREMEDLLGLSGLSQRKPDNLSGGQRQRVALGRALAVNPEILLLDEPLSNLDARIRLSVRHEIRALQQRLGITAVHVTHDREEAMVMADRIVILDGGRIVQQGAPQEIFNRPATAFVAAFMGAENEVRLTGRIEGDDWICESAAHCGAARMRLGGRRIGGGTVAARFRAEAAQLLAAADAPEPADDTLDLIGTVASVSYPGGHWRHAVCVADGEVQVDAPIALAPGTPVRVRVPGPAAFLFDTAPGGPAVSPRNFGPATQAGPKASGD
ncbi:ABC-type iron(III) transport system, ATPase component [Polymorphum gilvum SL003B-26A1]|uniref:ABC-type iron(III) transport system, ATPase component n=1 Tax=Polymorphum gilvum (strain LMG 25793 / CGMCC 1.9160 / SL003B-26A1) TaxID=991905 RepID=F2IXJ4_POLGS|nr:ABC-type iron(III) transport system, ATPase component [Polymorphum gilvum SL003B-26A1]